MLKYQKLIFITLISLSILLQTDFIHHQPWYTIKIGYIASISILTMTLGFAFYTKKQNQGTYIIIAIGMLFIIAKMLMK